MFLTLVALATALSLGTSDDLNYYSFTNTGVCLEFEDLSNIQYQSYDFVMSLNYEGQIYNLLSLNIYGNSEHGLDTLRVDYNVNTFTNFSFYLEIDLFFDYVHDEINNEDITIYYHKFINYAYGQTISVQDELFPDNRYEENVLSFTEDTGMNLYLRAYPFSEDIYNQYANLGNTSKDIYDSGYQNGYDSGYSAGQDNGIDTGYGIGYQDGYDRGVETQVADYGFMDLFGAVADTPIMMMRSMFNFDLFGVPVITVILSLLTALLLFFIIKKFIK